MGDPVRRGTVCFLRDGNQLLLALIEYGPTDSKWTGIGGFVEEGETLAQAVVREAREETYLELDERDLHKVAELNGPIQLNVFLADKWTGELKIKEPGIKELRWFPINDLPYSQMHPGTQNWLPQVLVGKLLKTTSSQITEVSAFD